MTLAAGNILEGTVVNITNFGAFVEVEGKTGLVHISEVADSFVKDIRQHLNEQDKVKVKVLSIDDNGKISLSIKQANVHKKSAKPAEFDWNIEKCNDDNIFYVFENEDILQIIQTLISGLKIKLTPWYLR